MRTKPARQPDPKRPLVKAQRSRGIYIILALLFGAIGLHDFYLGHLGRGAALFTSGLATIGVIVFGAVLRIPTAGICGAFGLALLLLFVLWEIFQEHHDGAGDPLC